MESISGRAGPLEEGEGDDVERRTEAWITCPYCGEPVGLIVDPGGGSHQEYVEDCEVCCRPWHLTVRWDVGGDAQVEARTEEES